MQFGCLVYLLSCLGPIMYWHLEARLIIFSCIGLSLWIIEQCSMTCKGPPRVGDTDGGLVSWTTTIVLDRVASLVHKPVNGATTNAGE
jgi:hypothetical protein